jgi:hypothetical protein
MHKERSELAGQMVKIKESANRLGGEVIVIEDWWDKVAGKSWMDSDGNPACIKYAIRTGESQVLEGKIKVPIDNEVLYGKIGCFGHLVHIEELESESEKQL